MRSLPWIKWFASNWLSSSARIEMSLPARAIYLDLLFQVYEYGGSIPSDHRQLQKLTMTTPEEFESSWPEVSKHLVPLEGDPTRLTNLVAKTHLERQTSEYAASQEAGRRGGRPKKRLDALDMV